MHACVCMQGTAFNQGTGTNVLSDDLAAKYAPCAGALCPGTGEEVAQPHSQATTPPRAACPLPPHAPTPPCPHPCPLRPREPVLGRRAGGHRARHGQRDARAKLHPLLARRPPLHMHHCRAAALPHGAARHLQRHGRPRLPAAHQDRQAAARAAQAAPGAAAPPAALAAPSLAGPMLPPPPARCACMHACEGGNRVGEGYTGGSMRGPSINLSFHAMRV